MIRLTATTETLDMSLSVAGDIEYTVSYDRLTASDVLFQSAHSQATSSGSTAIVAAPSSGEVHQVRYISARNNGSVLNNVGFIVNTSVNDPLVFKAVLYPGDVVEFSSDSGWKVLDSSGSVKTSEEGGERTGAYMASWWKTGTTLEGAYIPHMLAANPGNPGAWVVGTPGMSGRSVDGLVSPDNVGLLLHDATLPLYITALSVSSSVIGKHDIYDILWVNSGIVVTTTTAQTVNSVAFPARDRNESSDGVGVSIGLYVAVNTTNASAITNTTISYTNSDGVSGRTGTIASFPATGLVGTTVWFRLQAGDVGVRSVQSITLGTSYAAGTIHLVAAKKVVSGSVVTAGVFRDIIVGGKSGVKVSKNAMLVDIVTQSATTAATVSIDLTYEER